MSVYLQDVDVTGSCECGCGEPAPIATYSDATKGWKKGQPKRFINGHNGRGYRLWPRWTEEARGYETPCWIWQGKPNAQGYGQISRGGHHALAHRFMYRDAGHAVAKGEPLHHRCRVRLCVNPAHLEITTDAGNARQSSRTKLTAEIAAYIRQSNETRKALAARFGITETHVYRIRRGDSWA